MVQTLRFCFCAFVVLIGAGVSLCALEVDFNSMRATFIQKTTSQDNTLLYSGVFYIKQNSDRTHKAKWIYEKPTKKEIYIDGNQVLVYEPFLEQVSISKTGQKIDFLRILHEARLQKDGTYLAAFNDTNYVLTYHDKKDFTITFQDEFDNTIEIVFNNVQTNIPIKDEEFSFVIPPNVDIIQ